MATPRSGEKTMSSRLLTMKFMQRNSPTQSPHNRTAHSTPSGPPSKRIRLSNGTSSPASTTTPSSSTHQAAIQAALDAEEQKRLEALDKHAADHGETRWVLAAPATQRPAYRPSVVMASLADIDALESGSEDSSGDGSAEEREAEGTGGRRQYGRRKEREPGPRDAQYRSQGPYAGGRDGQRGRAGGDGEDGEDSEDSEDEEYDPAALLVHEVQKQREGNTYADQRAQQERVKEAAKQSHTADSKLRGLKSISGGRTGSKPSMDGVRCFKCGRNGHKKSDCPG